MGLFEVIFGPFILFGILIIAGTAMTGGKADRAFIGYMRLCGQLLTSILMPIITRLPFFIKYLGEHIEYLLDAQIKTLRERAIFRNVANGPHHAATNAANGNGNGKVITVQVKDITEEHKRSIGEGKQQNPYDDNPDIEVVDK